MEDVFESDVNIHMVMEIMQGGELFDYVVEKGTLSESEASVIVRKVMTIAYRCLCRVWGTHPTRFAGHTANGKRLGRAWTVLLPSPSALFPLYAVFHVGVRGAVNTPSPVLEGLPSPAVYVYDTPSADGGGGFGFGTPPKPTLTPTCCQPPDHVSLLCAMRTHTEVYGAHPGVVVFFEASAIRSLGCVSQSKLCRT